MGLIHYFRHLDTSESSLEIKVLEQFTVERRCYSHVTHRLKCVMCMSLIRLHMLCIRYSYLTLCIFYSYTCIRYAYGYTTYTDRLSSIARFEHSKAVCISSFFWIFHTQFICSIIRCSVSASWTRISLLLNLFMFCAE